MKQFLLAFIFFNFAHYTHALECYSVFVHFEDQSNTSVKLLKLINEHLEQKNLDPNNLEMLAISPIGSLHAHIDGDMKLLDEVVISYTFYDSKGEDQQTSLRELLASFFADNNAAIESVAVLIENPSIIDGPDKEERSIWQQCRSVYYEFLDNAYMFMGLMIGLDQKFL